MSELKQALQAQRFACVLEIASKPSPQHRAELQKILRRGHLAGWPLLPSFADRVGQLSAAEPLEMARTLNYPTHALLHFAGKNRERTDLLQQMAQMKAHGFNQLLLLSGDRLPGHDPGKNTVRYLESVSALQIAREYCPDWLLGAALNPFKYCEEDGMAQYLKAEKKIRAGADFLTIQLGFDAGKYAEAQHWMRHQSARKPMLACVMGLTQKRAEMLHHVPGIIITHSMIELLSQEQDISPEDARHRYTQRLALQILGLKLMGYAGIHLSGIHIFSEFLALEKAILAQQDHVTSLADWNTLWAQSWQSSTESSVRFSPQGNRWQFGRSTTQATNTERLRYTFLSGCHDQIFSQTRPLGKTFAWAMSQPIWNRPLAANALHCVERAIKKPLVGCDTCGQCRLPDTLYVCPETCPKGLANGPCGGTQLNLCEFGDRECIHNVKYRLAKSTGQISVLSETLIPPIEEQQRHRSSWPDWFNTSPSSTKS